MDCSVLCWREAALREMKRRGLSGINVEILVAYRGHPVETATWGACFVWSWASRELEDGWLWDQAKGRRA